MPTESANPQPFQPRPSGRPVMHMIWRDLLFLHWPVAPAPIAALLPAGVTLDTFDGRAWIGLVPFLMDGVRAQWCPAIPGTSRFPECNVRTYVVAGGEPGVWFFTLDADHFPAVAAARLTFGLNYRLARIRTGRSGAVVDYQLDRLDQQRRPHLAQRYDPMAVAAPRLRCGWRIGAPLPPAQPGELFHFLTERYCLYSQNRKAELLRGRIWHDRWALREASVERLEDDLVAAAGVDIGDAAPIALHGEDRHVRAWMPQRVLL